MFFSSAEGDRSSVEKVISGVGLTPVYVGEDQEALLDAVFQLWVALAIKQGYGRRLALVRQGLKRKLTRRQSRGQKPGYGVG